MLKEPSKYFTIGLLGRLMALQCAFSWYLNVVSHRFCLPSHFLTKGPDKILMNPARQTMSVEYSSRTWSIAVSNSTRLLYNLWLITCNRKKSAQLFQWITKNNLKLNLYIDHACPLSHKDILENEAERQAQHIPQSRNPKNKRPLQLEVLLGVEGAGYEFKYSLQERHFSE